MILIGRYRSPFVRRVGATLQLYDIAYEHRPLATTGEGSEQVAALNPIGRVPVLVLDDGEALVDSTVIIDYLDSVVGPDRALTPRSGPDRRRVMTAIGIANGAVEKAVLTVYEVRFRPEEKRHQPWVDRCARQARNGFEHLDGQIRGPWYMGEHMSQADVSIVAYWEFLKVAAPKLVDGIEAQNVDALAARALALPAFQNTVHRDP
jgi:glutathione S-transferase